MTYIRSKVRYNCFCMKKGNKPKDSAVVDVIAKQLGSFTWDKFGEEWDVAVHKNNIVVVRNIKDINKVMEVCLYAQFAAKQGIEIADLNDEDMAVVHMIESQFLEGRMTWANYRSHWNVRWDDERKRVETYLLNLPLSQQPVTEEMIQHVLDRGVNQAKKLVDEILTISIGKKE